MKACYREHSSIMEMKAVDLTLRWVLRSSKRFHKRVALLIDAKAELCAIAKGRSGAHQFRRTLPHICALLFASDTLLRPIYVPSEDNPADGPSRGHRRRPIVRQTLRKPGFSKSDRRLHRAHCELKRKEAFMASCFPE